MKLSVLKTLELSELNTILEGAFIDTVETEEEALSKICESLEVEIDIKEEERQKPKTDKYITEIRNGEYTNKYLIKDDIALNLSTGQTITLKEFNKLLEKSKGSNWELITESNPLQGNEVSENAQIIYLDVTYDIDNKLYKFQIDLALEFETNSIFAIKYNLDKDTTHYKNFDKIDNSLLAIINNMDNGNLKNETEYLDKESLMAKVVACLEVDYEEIPDDKAGYSTSQGVIFYDENQGYKLQNVSLDKKTKSGNRRRL